MAADEDRPGARDPAGPSSGGNAGRGRGAGPDHPGSERRVCNRGCSSRRPGRGATGRQFGHLLDDAGRSGLSALRRRDGQPRSQQHPGVVAGPGQGQRLRDRPAGRPGDRGAQRPELPAAGRVEVHPRTQWRRAEGRPPVDGDSRRGADSGHRDRAVAGLGRQRHRSDDRWCRHRAADPRAGDRCSEPAALGAGRHPVGPAAQQPLPRPVRVRGAALRHRQLQRGQRRVGLLPDHLSPRLLLRVRRHAAASPGDDRGPQAAAGRHRRPRHVPLRRQHLLHRLQRLLPHGGHRHHIVDELRAGRGPALGLHRATTFRAGPSSGRPAPQGRPR